MLPRLFQADESGRLVFGWAKSKDGNRGRSAPIDWTEFRDYIMEGFVAYLIRVQEVPEGLALEVRLCGTNRDEYVLPTVKQYIRWAGLEPMSVETESLH